MTTQLFQIQIIANSVKTVNERTQILISKGYRVEERRMGSGGKGSIKTVAGETRVQIGYGHGSYNYAMCVIL